MLTQIKLQDGNLIVHSSGDVEDTLEGNHQLRSMPQTSDWIRHVYRVPNEVVLQILNEAWQRGHYVKYLSKEFEELVTRKLRDREFYKLRVDK